MKEMFCSLSSPHPFRFLFLYLNFAALFMNEPLDLRYFCSHPIRPSHPEPNHKSFSQSGAKQRCPCSVRRKSLILSPRLDILVRMQRKQLGMETTVMWTRLTSKAVLWTALAFSACVLLGQPALSKASLLDAGTLVSVEKKNGTAIEKYSDGLTVQIGADDSIRDDCPKDQYTMEARVIGESAPEQVIDDNISMLLDFAWMHGHRNPNDSRVQSRLRQFSTYYLKKKEPEKAKPLAARYLHIQKVLQVKGEPLAFAQRNLADADLALGEFNEAIPLLSEAMEYYEHEGDKLIYCNILSDLGDALLKVNRPQEALSNLEICRKTITENRFESLQSKVDANYQRALKATGKKR